MAGEAIMAATAIENNKILCTANIKHFKVIQELTLKAFKPV
jgi:predicted nucleic acid-binding protein